MLSKIKKLSVVYLLFVPLSALASISVADFHSSNITGESSSPFNKFDLTVDGVGIHVSAWSDTKGQTLSGVDGDTDIDPYIERAYDLDPNRNGWSVVNQDEINTGNCGYSHSADNLGSSCNYQDYDFFMLEFTESVTLSEAFYSWAYGGSDHDVAASRNQVSVAAIASNDIEDSTWGTIAADAGTTSDWSQLHHDEGNYNHHYYSEIGTSGAGNGGNLAGVYSNIWLIGAINEVFGGEGLSGNDGMKLAGVKFSTEPTETSDIPEPSSIALFSLALAGLFSSSRKNNHFIG